MSPVTKPHSARPLTAPLDPALVIRMQAAVSAPSVSLLLNTRLGARMTAADATRLRQLAVTAGDRLSAEPAGESRDKTSRRLAEVVRRAIAGPTSTSLAVYCSASEEHIVPLQIEVNERAVVEPSFATRDLLRALHRAPRHLVLVLTGTQARLFSGQGPHLLPVVGSAFPLVAGPAEPRSGVRERTPGRAGRPHSSDSRADPSPFLQQVDQALGSYRMLHPSPLVLIGPTRLLTRFRELSHNLNRLAGTVTGSHTRTPLPALAHLVRPVLDAYLHSRQAEALDLLDRRMGTDRVVTGMAAVWLAAHYKRVEMLAVEDTLIYPARLSDDGDLVVPAEDVGAPDVLDDAVDELIELVLARGGWVALVEQGALAHCEGVALALTDQD
ncbi:MAG TPA: hypothetical protein VES01_02495 [Dermatophilaceae bacterium]|nr:hypothetical protein [Dermatophilaceae bacterium]